MPPLRDGAEVLHEFIVSQPTQLSANVKVRAPSSNLRLMPSGTLSSLIDCASLVAGMNRSFSTPSPSKTHSGVTKM